MSDVTIADFVVGNGQRQRIDLPVARLPTQTVMTLPIEVVNGRHEGPRLWLSAALHGDELNGVEIVQRVLEKLNPRTLHGEVVAIPIVNVFGFINQQRYLPDGRDLNRCFPGSASGSLASRLAHLFMTQIVAHCSHGIDLHTGGAHRTNLPQVRCDFDDPEARRMAEAFGAPIMIHGESPPGSLRTAVAKRGKPILVYEAGESHRFNSHAINVGVKGVLRVMAALNMIPKTAGAKAGHRRISMEASHRTWIRALRSGILRLKVKLGQSVTEGQTLGVIRDAFGDDKIVVTSPGAGLVIGHTNHPLVHEGDGIIHLALDVTTHRV